MLYRILGIEGDGDSILVLCAIVLLAVTQDIAPDAMNARIPTASLVTLATA